MHKAKTTERNKDDRTERAPYKLYKVYSMCPNVSQLRLVLLIICVIVGAIQENHMHWVNLLAVVHFILTCVKRKLINTFQNEMDIKGLHLQFALK